jgi:hypothetical protein
MVYLFCGIFGGALLAAVVIPLFRKDDSLESAIMEETEWDLLQRKKEVILGNIQDLDFEYKCGKLSEEDYKHVRAGMSAEAAAVLRQIDEIEQSRDLDALIRREVSDRRGRARGEAATHDCPGCGSPNPVTNKFCAECGVKLKS